MLKEATTKSGEKFFYTVDDYTGYLWWANEEGEQDYGSCQSFPLGDRDDYRYTHGGKVYREAVEKIWEIENPK